MKPYKQWDKLPINWCRISAINRGLSLDSWSVGRIFLLISSPTISPRYHFLNKKMWLKKKGSCQKKKDPKAAPRTCGKNYEKLPKNWHGNGTLWKNEDIPACYLSLQFTAGLMYTPKVMLSSSLQNGWDRKIMKFPEMGLKVTFRNQAVKLRVGRWS